MYDNERARDGSDDEAAKSGLQAPPSFCSASLGLSRNAMSFLPNLHKFTTINIYRQ